MPFVANVLCNVISGLGWGPKDDRATWVALLVTVLVFYFKRGLDLRTWIKWTFADESKGLRKVLQNIFPPSMHHHLDLRHQVATCRRLPANYGGKSWGEFLAGTVQFMSALPSLRLFDFYARHWFTHGCVRDGSSCADFAGREVFVYDSESSTWRADWYCGVQFGKSPGVTSDTVSQSLESTWDAIKGAISCQLAHKDIALATSKVAEAVIALWIRRGWLVASPGSSQWQLQTGREGHSWPLTHAAWPSDRLIAGSPHSTQRFIFEGDVQRKVHSVVDYVRFAPSNFFVSSVSRAVLGFKVSLFYTALCL